MRDVVDVEAAGRDVGGDQHVDLAGAERPQRLLAGALAEVAVHGGGGEAAVVQVVGDLLRRSAWSGEKTIVRPRPRACRIRASISTLSIACAR